MTDQQRSLAAGPQLASVRPADVTTDATRHLVIDLASLRFLDSSGVALVLTADCEIGVHACGCAIRMFIRLPGRPKC